MLLAAIIDRFVNWSLFFDVSAILTLIPEAYQEKKSILDNYGLVKFLAVDLKQSLNGSDQWRSMLILDTIINNITSIYINKLSPFPK